MYKQRTCKYLLVFINVNYTKIYQFKQWKIYRIVGYCFQKHRNFFKTMTLKITT